MINNLIDLSYVCPRVFGLNVPKPIEWTIKEGEQWCIVGPNGAGKTFLADLLQQKWVVKSGRIDYLFWSDEYRIRSGKSYPVEAIQKVSFESAYSLSDYHNMYYQQRFHSSENEFTPTVKELLSSAQDKSYLEWLCGELRINQLFEKHLIMLSSGELRRLLIVLALSKRPQLIIFDNPFIGLDKDTRIDLNFFFKEIVRFQQMMFLVPSIDEIPEVTTHILKADSLCYEAIDSPSVFVRDYRDWLTPKESNEIVTFPSSKKSTETYRYVFRMKDISLSYGDKYLFKHLNWEVKKGEKWALMGKNGSGKSTLLSLFVADNPKAYSLNIEVFDKRRGSGESIWDIKRRIGYISSEMHLYFREPQSCLQIVSSGFFDTMGLFRKCSAEQEEKALQWMKLLKIDYLKGRSFLKLSSGEQRLVLLARTMVKSPEVLILDEPLHGLDMSNKRNVRKLIDQYCNQRDITLIYVTHQEEEIPSCVNQLFDLSSID